MKRFNLSIIAIGLLGLPLLASADPIRVAYQIGDYQAGGFSASALHSADGCRSMGPTTERSLFMCGSRIVDDVTGMIYGILRDNGALRITGGNLVVNGNTFNIRDGVIRPFSDTGDRLSNIRIAGLGNFWFEHLQMGSGRPNSFDGNELILWGQNDAAYRCNGSRSDYCRRNGWGIDLYGSRVSVSEPGTMALLGLGLIGLGLSRRRKLQTAS